MAPPEIPGHAPRRHGAAVLLLGTLLALAGALWQRHENARHLREALQREGERAAELALGRLARAELGLRGARGVVLGAGLDEVELRRFRAYFETRDLAREFPGVLGVGLARRQADGRLLVQAFEPVEARRVALGADLSADPGLHAAAQRALTSGQATISAPRPVALAPGEATAGVHMLLPVVDNGVAVAVVFSPLRLDSLFEAAATAPALLTMHLHDVDDVGGLVAAHVPPRPSAPDDASGLPLQLQHEAFGRLWRFTAHPLPALETSLTLVSPWVVFGLGVALALLSATLTQLLVVLHARSRVRHSERGHRVSMLDHTSDAVFCVDLQGRITLWNRSAQRLFGIDRTDALGRTPHELGIDRGDAGAAEARLDASRSGNATPPFEAQRYGREGAPIDLEITSSPMYDPRDQVVGMVEVMRPISQRLAQVRNLEAHSDELAAMVSSRTAELERANRDMRTVLDALPSLVGSWDRALRNRFANAAHRAWFGIDPAQVQGQEMGRVVGAELFARLLPRLRATLDGQPQVFEESWTGPDGGPLRHAQVHALPERVDGRIEGCYLLMHDVTQLVTARLEMDAALRQSEAFLDTVRTHAIVSITDRAGTILEVNDNFCAISEYRRDELLGRNHRMVSSGLHERDFWRSMWATIGAGQPWRGEVCNRAKSGRLYWVDSMVAPIPSADGSVERFVSIRQDVTERKAAQQRLAEAATRADAASRAKSEFLANMSHEIRTPLNAVLGLAYMLGRSALPASQAQMVSQIQHAGQSLLGLVNDVLDLAKIESGRLELETRPFDLRRLLGQEVRLLTPGAQAKGLAVEFHIDPELPQVVIGDAMRLRQILNNLLGNAIKFTAGGSVTLSVAPGAVVDQVRFDVTDTGIGIAEDVQTRLFQPFTQAETSTTRRFGGSGLGLSIVARLCASMGGTVSLRSTPGQGSCFTVTVPLPAAPDQWRDERAEESGVVRVLVADDDRAQREQMSGLAHALGWQVDAVAGGVPLVSAVLAAEQSGHPFQALVVDWKMPDLDGLAALATLRRELSQRGRAARWPPAILVSAHDLDEARRAEHAELASAVLSKPLDGPALFDAVNRAVASGEHGAPAQGPGARGASGESQWLHGVHALVADDSTLNLDVARHVLELEGARVTACSRGEEALELLQQPELGVDVVLMDVQMPGIDGNETVRRLRQVPHLKDVPVIALSAGVQYDDRAKAMAAGMTDFLPKPVEPQRLVRCIRRHVERFRGAAIRLVPRGPTESAVAPAAPLQLQGIDSERVAPSLLAERSLYLSMLRRFLVEFGDFAAPVATATPAAGLTARLHKMRGSAQVVGAQAIAEAAGNLEDALKAGDESAAAESRQQLADRVEELATASRELLCAEAQRQAEHDRRAAQAAPQSGDALDARSLRELRNLLDRQSLDSVALFRSLENGLRQRLGTQEFAQLRAAIEDYDFARVRDALRELR